MPQPSRVPRVFVTLLFLAALLPASNRAGTWVAFQNSYARGTGSPVTVTDTFTLLNPATQYTLKAFNGGLQDDTTELVSGCVVLVNGVQVIGPGNFNKNVSELDVPVALLASNTISVQVKGKPGGVLAIEIIGVDNDPPIITASVSPSPNAAGWNNSPVTVTFTCSDKTSGVASCPAPITVSTEGANQVVSGTATDLAGNTSATSVTINLDMTPPTITGTINPPPDSGGYNSGPVTVTFACADALSGVASCSSPVSVTTEGTFQETGTAVDVAGNTATTTLTVNISFNYFKIRSWQTNPPGDPSQTGKCLDYAGASVFLNDCSAAHPIRVFEIGATPPCATANPPTCTPPPPRTGHAGILLYHEVMLFAGNQVIGVQSPQTIISIGPPQPVTEYQLELQAPFATPAQQIWRLDGDSIILEGSHLEVITTDLLPVSVEVPGPCINTDTNALCPAPTPQLVIQVQNARGANSSPLVAAKRNLAYNEFWDFIPGPSSPPYPTTGFAFTAGSPTGTSPMPITTNWQLWNAICASPQLRARIDYPIIYDPGQNDDNQVLPSYYKGCVSYQQGLGWGSVIIIAGDDQNECISRPDVGSCIDLSNYPPITLPTGVTIRGNRRGTLFGPQLFASYSAADESFTCDRTCIFSIGSDYVRVTGLRVHGQSRSTDSIPSQIGKTDGMWINYPGVFAPTPAPLFNLSTITQYVTTVDHNDMSDWMDGAVATASPFFNGSTGSTSKMCGYHGYVDPSFQVPNNYYCDENIQTESVPFPMCSPQPCSQPSPLPYANDPSTLANIWVARNFLHHNMRDDGGYGVTLEGRALIEGNTFLWNRHDITAAAEPHNEYRASHNLVLAEAYGHYGFLGADGRLQDFDMHGTANPSIYIGGAAGYYVEIDGNTFLGQSGLDYRLRGYPVKTSYYHNNVSNRKEGDALEWDHCFSGPLGLFGCAAHYSDSDFQMHIDVSSTNQFADSNPPYTDPTVRFGVGDFDGDGDDDLLLTTGAAWYYSPAGAREWRFLSAKTDRIDTLLLGDFDGDGRTDVVGMNPSGQFDVSWGGFSDWEVINQSPCANGVPNPCPTSVQNMVVGDFDGDGTPDILYTDKVHWYISYGGTAPFTQVNDSSFLVKDLRFGHFSVCGNGAETDVFSVQSTGWQVSCGATSGWTPLGGSLTNPVDGLLVADFNGGGFADVAMSCFSILNPGCWQISLHGNQAWQQYTIGSWDTDLAAVGHFLGHVDLNGNPIPADLLFWNTTPPIAVVAMCDSSVGVNTELCLSVGGKNQSYRYTSQDMR